MYVVANTLNTLVLRTFCWCCIHFSVFTGALCAGSRVEDATPKNTNMGLIWPIKRYRYRYRRCAFRYGNDYDCYRVIDVILSLSY